MHTWIVEHLRCPQCHQQFQLTTFATEGNEVLAGVLRCDGITCQAWYPVYRGIPRLLPPHLRATLTDAFAREFSRQLHECRISVAPALPAQPPSSSADGLHAVKVETMRNFGFEWTKYARFGWDDAVFNLEREEQVFLYKSLLPHDGLEGQLVLDAGCGNGRYSYWAARHGARVIGVDLGDGVSSAYANTKALDSVGIVQADIFDLPFGLGTFDAIFSIGVLMHTGDAKRATARLATLVKPSGTVTVHLYGKGNPIYEFVDRTLRKRTVRLSIPELEKFTERACQLIRTLATLRLLPVAAYFVRLDPHPHCIFDWYSAPVASHHTYAEVTDWFKELGMRVVETHEPKRLVSRLKHRLKAGTVTVRAQKTVGQ